MTLSKIFILSTAVLFLFNAQAKQTIDQTGPIKLVESLSKTVLQQRIHYENKNSNKKKSNELIRFSSKKILPYIDTKKMSRYIMGTYWRTASPEQRENFYKQFEKNLLHSYSNSILKIKTFAITGSSKEGKRKVIISSKVTQYNGNSVKIQYRAYQNKKTKLWYLYDIVIENISMLLNYRKTYAVAFQNKGIDGVIAELKEKNNLNFTQPKEK